MGKLSNLVIYTKLSDLGLPSRGVTVNQIYNAMDDYSMALIDVQNSEVITDGPGSSGLLEIYKVAAGRNFARCTISNSTGTDVAQIWYGVFTWAGDKKFQGWHRITDDKFFNWNSLPGKPSTFTPAGHTQDASTISGVFVNKDMRWYLGNGTDYAQIRQSGNTNNRYCAFVFHDTDQNKDTTHDIFDPNGNFLLAKKSDISSLQSSFQAGVDTLYNKCVSCGSTPSNKTPTAISNSIQSIYNNRYSSGRNDVYKTSKTTTGYGNLAISLTSKPSSGTYTVDENTFNIPIKNKFLHKITCNLVHRFSCSYTDASAFTSGMQITISTVEGTTLYTAYVHKTNSNDTVLMDGQTYNYSWEFDTLDHIINTSYDYIKFYARCFVRMQYASYVNSINMTFQINNITANYH